MEKASEFLIPPDLPSVYDHYPDLHKAISRLKIACEKKECIAICGDYDADGMTSSALLLNVFSKLKANVKAFIPDRVKEGYGLNINMIEKIKESGIKLIITVDNGVSALEAIKLSKEYKIEIILTDHHAIKHNFLDVFALIHPSTLPDKSPYKDLAGVGLAYILAANLARELKSKETELDSLDLFTIGTIADMTPLTGANRSLLIEGLKHIHKTNLVGLQSLYQISGIKGRMLTAEDIGYSIAPRINAVGRIGDPKLVLDLLTEVDQTKALELASNCNNLNTQRKLLSDGVSIEANALIDSDKDKIPNFILLAQNHWHQGIIGIVAARICEKYNRPTAILTTSEGQIYRGSVRTPSWFSAIDSLESCRTLLEAYGGHKAAAGFTVKNINIALLSDKLNEYTVKHIGNDSKPKEVKPDSYLSLKRINLSFYDSYKKLEPFGVGNHMPVFWCRECKVISSKFLSGGHLKLLLDNGKESIEAIKWNAEIRQTNSKLIDIVFNIRMNYWNNQNKIQLDLISIRDSSKVVNIKKNGRLYSCFIKDSRLCIKNAEGRTVELENNKKGINDFLDKNHNPYMRSLLNESLNALGLRV